MGLLDLLFGTKKKARKRTLKNTTRTTNTPQRKIPQKVELATFEGLAEIRSIGFLGEYRASTSGEWIICWSDSDRQSGISGHRPSGLGRYVLYNKKQEKIIAQGKLERPNNGHVSNNGTFSIEDWHLSDELIGTFYIFSSSELLLIKREFSANIYDSGLSENGKLAVCQTANAAGDDGGVLAGFSIADGRELFCTVPPDGWADDYKFDEQRLRFGLVYKNLGTFYYNEKGELENPEKLESARLNSSSLSTVLMAVEDIVKSDISSKKSLEMATKAIDRVLNTSTGKDDFLKARAFKVSGLAHERLGNEAEALSSFNAALAINPKIGVKRKATAIQKRLGAKDSQ